MVAIDALLIGAGMRGRHVYGRYARAHPERLCIAAVAEPDPERRAVLAREHGLAPDRVFSDWRELFDRGPSAPAVIVATDDMTHVEPALAALERGHHLLLEKPIAPDLADCLRIVRTAEERGRILQISHVLRYTAFYRRVAEILRSGRIGRLLTLDMKEHVAHWHMAHSYVRGKFRNRVVAAPIILAKCCHDLDLMTWLVDRPARRLASFGELSHYRAERAPEGAPDRCSAACPVQQSCPHDAERLYLGVDENVARSWPWWDVSRDPTREARREALATGHDGRCVYRCDNDVPDHQVVSLEFEDGVLATLTMQGHATHETRTIRASGSLGELRGILAEGVIEISRHGELASERIEIGESALDHFGGDGGLLDHFTDVVSRDAANEVKTSGRASLESHVLGFAAEEARLGGCVVDLEEFRRRQGAQ